LRRSQSRVNVGFAPFLLYINIFNIITTTIVKMFCQFLPAGFLAFMRLSEGGVSEVGSTPTNPQIGSYLQFVHVNLIIAQKTSVHVIKAPLASECAI
jgi:hypothetical protein